MTEEMTPEFLQFSEMLDQEDSPLGDSSEAKLLLDLRDVLKEGVEPEPDFADKTTEVTLQKFAQLSPGIKAWDGFQRLLCGPALSPRALPVSGALLGLLVVLSSLKLELLIPFALTLTALCCTYWFDGTAVRGVKLPTLLHNLLPLSVVLATALMAGSGIAGLGRLSFTLKKQAVATNTLAALVGLGIVVLFLRAARPLNRALRLGATVHPWALLAYQAFCGVWLAGLISVVVPNLWQPILACCLLMSIITTILVKKENTDREGIPSLTKAFATILVSLGLGILPLGLALVVFYQFHLTEVIHKDHQHVVIKQEVSDWVEEQRNIAPDQNGWVLLRPFLLSGPDKEPANSKVAQNLVGLFEFHHSNLRKPISKAVGLESYQKAKRDFLQELPRIRTALSKPYFSHIPTQGFGFEIKLPDYFVFRNIGGGIALLSEEAALLGRSDAAVEYAVLGLQWSSSISETGWIGQVFRIMLWELAAEPLERVMMEGHCSEEQLRQISLALKKYGPHHLDYAIALKREIYQGDKFFELLKTENPTVALELPPYFRLVPTSYWESERKSFWNYALSNTTDWYGLALHESETTGVENLAFSWAAQVLRVGGERMRGKFILVHSRFQALKLECALELFKLDMGFYPDTLNELTPGYLERIPVDTMDPKLYMSKGTFAYSKTESGYLLTSKSPGYEQFRYTTEQVYGHDGNYRLVKEDEEGLR